MAVQIAVDGYSATGKSTLSKQLAKALGFTFIDTGAMYRAVSYFAIEHDIITKDDWKNELVSRLDRINIGFQYVEGEQHMFLNGKDVEEEIRTIVVSNWVSPVSTIPEVREKLVGMQQEIGSTHNVVMDGRDIGTVVFPDAILKLFITATLEERTNRRYRQIIDNEPNTTREEVMKNLQARDEMDSNRAVAPLKPAEDAVQIDNTNLTANEQFEMCLALAKCRI